jgi:hypothetical protein
MMTETEKAVCLAIIQHLRESRALSDDIRIGVSLYEVPDILLQPRRVLDGDTGLRVEPVTPLRRSPRFALYLDGPHPVSVVRADLEFYRPGYVAARELTGGVLLHPEDVKTAAVRISHEELERRAGQSAGATGARAFSLSGYSSGYRYRLRGGLAAGEPILGRNVESIAPVEGGDEVVASFERSGISLTIPGRALSSGGIGEVVTVRLSTGKKTKLRVTGHRRVASPRPNPRKVTLHE